LLVPILSFHSFFIEVSFIFNKILAFYFLVNGILIEDWRLISCVTVPVLVLMIISFFIRRLAPFFGFFFLMKIDWALSLWTLIIIFEIIGFLLKLESVI